MEYFVDALKNYVNFSGRLGVRGYWMFVLFNVIFSTAAWLVSMIPFLFFVGGLYGLAVLLPGLAATVRRLQDTGKSWVWILVSLIPVVGAIWLIVLLCAPGVEGDNEFGAPAKA